MGDGRSLKVTHPELAAMSPSGRLLVAFGSDNVAHHIDLLLATDLVDGGNGKPRKRRRKA
jgi:hypothetical protein